MKLKSGCMFWPAMDGAAEAHPPLERDLTREVVVVGGGISGALAAYFLARAGVGVALVDRREACHGSTAASTGLLQYEIDTPLVQLARKIGAENAAAAYRRCVRALEEMGPLVADLDDDADLTPRRSLCLASRAADAAALREEWQARRRCAIAVEYLDEGAIRERFSFSAPAALYSQAAMEVDPFRLARALLRRAAALGAEVYSHTDIVAYAPDDSGVTLLCRRGMRLRARRVVVATGYEAPELIGPSWARLKSTYALASAPLARFDGWCERCLSWETARPYFYLRSTPDGRAMMGGADEDFADPPRRDRLIEDKARQLAQRFERMFPAIALTPVCCWAGTFAQTRDGLPYIGGCGRFPNGYFALGYGGNGITFSLIAAEIIRDLYTGRANPAAHLFRFDR
jgi:glycine/D-amino acid oxidase-like deaminating enzyme